MLRMLRNHRSLIAATTLSLSLSAGIVVADSVKLDYDVQQSGDDHVLFYLSAENISTQTIYNVTVESVSDQTQFIALGTLAPGEQVGDDVLITYPPGSEPPRLRWRVGFNTAAGEPQEEIKD